MMTSRSEYRLLLRQDNADERLTEIGYRVGLIDSERYNKFLKKQEAIRAEICRMEATTLAPTSEVNELLTSLGSTPISTGIKLSELLRRPEITYAALSPIDKERPALSRAVAESAEIRVKYAGYIKRELSEVERHKKLEDKRLPADIDYKSILGLRLEAAEKLDKIRPESLGQASRISGVNPSDISVLLIYLSQGKCQ
jgi:tRNA uridine 5-carboxymethylaminomethyl modification enzyme